MKTKKITAFIIALSMILSISGCNNSKKNSSSQDESSSQISETEASGTEAAKPELTYDDSLKKGVLMNIGGFDVSEDEYKYYFTYAKSYIDAGDTSYWDDDPDSSKLENLKSQTLDYLFSSYTIYVLAKENNVELTDEDNAKIDKEMESTKLYYELSNEGSTFEDYLKSIACTHDVYRETVLREALEHKIVNSLYESDFRNNYFGNYLHAKYILINTALSTDGSGSQNDIITINPDLTYSEEETAAINKINQFAKAADQENLNASVVELINILRAQLDAGATMDSVLDKYTSDSALNMNDDGTYTGYYIAPNSMPAEFINAATALEDNQVSEAIESTGYGYYLIQRLPFDEEYLKDNIIFLYMSDSEYSYASNYSKLCSDTQNKIEVKYSHDYDKITADYADSTPLEKDSGDSSDTSTTEKAGAKTEKQTEASSKAETKKAD